MSLSFIKRGAKSGFTLIELLVVIAIIGVLASIVLASLNTARRKSRDARRISDIKQIQLALELYYDSTTPIPGYPPASENVAANCTATLAYGLQALSTGGFIPQLPRDPNATPNCYRYATPTIAAAQITYHLAAQLEDPANPAFSGDKDCNSSVIGGGAGFCTNVPAAYTGAFDGGVTVLDATGRMYDVIP